MAFNTLSLLFLAGTVIDPDNAIRTSERTVGRKTEMSQQENANRNVSGRPSGWAVLMQKDLSLTVEYKNLIQYKERT